MFLAFLKTMGITTGVAWGCIALPLYLLAEPTIVWGALVGCLVAAVCFTAGFYAICWSFYRSSRAFMISVFGGMLARLLFVGAVVLLLLRLTSLHVIGLISSLLGFYVVYFIIELYFVNNRLHSQKEHYE